MFFIYVYYRIEFNQQLTRNIFKLGLLITLDLFDSLFAYWKCLSNETFYEVLIRFIKIEK